MSTEIIDCTKLNNKADDICLDYDGDCKDVPCPLHCWLYAPERGICPLIGEG